MIVTVPPNGSLRPGVADFSDLTTATQTGPAAWVDGVVEIPFDHEPSEVEQSAIRLRLLTRDAAHEAQVKAMQAALADIRANPTTPAELAAAVELLLVAQLGVLA